MKSFRTFTAAVLWTAAAIFIITNLFLHSNSQNKENRMYRVETERLVRQIDADGYKAVRLTDCQYVYHVERCPAEALTEDFLAGTGSDTVFRQIGESVYRFDYAVQAASLGKRLVLGVNLALGALLLLLVFVLFYVRRNIIRPFEAFRDVPFALAKGQLAVPVPESKNRFFGRFAWGVDLLRESMEQQKKRELKLQRDQKTLVLSVSHDIKTPLSAIKLYAKVISRHMYADETQLKEAAESIHTKADEIGEFVTHLIKAAGEDFLQLEVVQESFYLSQLVERTTAYYDDKLRLLHTEFIVEHYADCMLQGDLQRSVEVLYNLMENAVKYGDGRAVRLTFSEEEGCVLVTVKNSGNTLPDAELPHIFDSFWRGSNAASSTGSGLGLYICRTLMQRMGGDIFASPQDGQMCVTAVWRI